MGASLPYPPRVALARLPTPVERLVRLGAALPPLAGIELWVKRDDLTGAELTGNKVRKLEFLLAEAQGRGADVVLTCGGAQSNHARATALAARRLGMDALLFLRTPNPQQPPPATGNVLLDRLAGAEIRWITPDEYGRRAELMTVTAETLRLQGRRPYVIPEGGSNAMGAWGYVACLEELLAQVPPPLTVVYACGSGGTGAGLLLGRKLLGADVRLVGVNVCDDRDYFVRTIGAIARFFAERFVPGLGIADEEIEIQDGYVGRGYALARPEELRVLAAVARGEGLVLDPVYTGKAFFGMVSELAREPARFGPRVVFLHSGGIFGLLGQAGDVEAALAAPG